MSDSDSVCLGELVFLNDNVSVFNISAKYAVENIFIIKIIKTNNKNFNVNISFYSRQTEEILIIGDLNLYNNMNLHKHILIYLTNWWKNKYLIDNKKHKIICVINSKNYSDLINIKNIIENLSQFKSLNLLTISYNNNIEKIEFYGNYDVLAKSLLLNKININISNGCIINSLN